MQIEVIVGDNVRGIREKKLDVSQEKLAELADLHRTYIGMVERAETSITVKNLEKIAKALGVDTNVLLIKNYHKTLGKK